MNKFTISHRYLLFIDYDLNIYGPCQLISKNLNSGINEMYPFKEGRL